MTAQRRTRLVDCNAVLVINQDAVRRAETDVMAAVAPGARFAVEVK